MFSLADIHQSSCHPSSYVFAVLAIFLGSSSTISSSQKGEMFRRFSKGLTS